MIQKTESHFPLQKLEMRQAILIVLSFFVANSIIFPPLPPRPFYGNRFTNVVSTQENQDLQIQFSWTEPNITYKIINKTNVAKISDLPKAPPMNNTSPTMTAPSTIKNAVCKLVPNNSTVSGIVSFTQASADSPVIISVSIKGLNPNSKHGFHVHEFGDLTDGCAATAGHYNPDNNKHQGPQDQARHAGDLGNIVTDQDGNAFYNFQDEEITLFGQRTILGRGIVVHLKEDDLGKGGNEQSLKTGNAGARIACGVIGIAKQFKVNIPK